MVHDQVPQLGTAFDYYINPKTGKFESWANMLKLKGDADFDSREMSMSTVFVPTSETSSFMYFLDMMLKLLRTHHVRGPCGYWQDHTRQG